MPDAQLAIPDPTALSVLDSEKILTRSAAGVSSSLPDAQWSDTVPKLLQTQIIQAFENAGTLGAVSRPLEGVTGDFQLLIDIRRFQIAVGAEPAADVELTAKVLDGKGRIVDTRTFSATVPRRPHGRPRRHRRARPGLRHGGHRARRVDVPRHRRPIPPGPRRPERPGSRQGQGEVRRAGQARSTFERAFTDRPSASR